MMSQIGRYPELLRCTSTICTVSCERVHMKLVNVYTWTAMVRPSIRSVYLSLATLCVLMSITMAPTPAQGEPLLSGSWSTEFVAPGFDGHVYELVETPDGKLIASGSFTSVDGVPADGLAVWDGLAWSAHPAGGIDDSGRNFYGLVVSPDGVLYVKTVLGLQRWTASGWETLPASTRMQPPVFDSAGNLFAIHSVLIGNEPSTVIYRDQVQMLSGDTWQPLGDAVDSPGAWYRRVFKVAIGADDDLLRATTAGVQRWDGSDWVDPLGGGFPVAFESLDAFAATTDGSVVASGWITAPEFRFSTLHWDGQEWFEYDSGAYIGVIEAHTDGQFVAFLENQLVSLTGLGWAPTPAAGDQVLSSDVVSYQGTLVIAGSSGLSSDNEWLGGVARLDPDGSWSGVHKSSGGKGLAGWIYTGVATQDGKLVVGGQSLLTFDGQQGSVMTWDGSDWSVAKDDGVVSHLVVTSDGKLVSVGSDGIRVQNVESWELISDQLDVKDLAATNSGGLVTLSAEGRVRLWDGNSWTELPRVAGDPVVGRPEKVVVLLDDSVVVTGSFDLGPVVRLVNRTWQGLGLVNGYVEEAAVSPEGDVYVLGKFDLPDGRLVDGIAYWDGVNWVPLRSNPRGVLAFDGCDVPLIGRSNGPSLERWNGSGWQTLGRFAHPNYISEPSFVVSIGPDTYVGGRMQSVDGQQSIGIALWTSPKSGFRQDAGDLDELIVSCDYNLSTHPDALRLYQAFFGREPDLAGAQYWIDTIDDGASLDEVAYSFTLSQEFRNNYEGTSDEAYLEAVYLNVLGREYDQDGFDYWLNLLSSGQLTRGGVVRWIAANPEFATSHPYGDSR